MERDGVGAGCGGVVEVRGHGPVAGRGGDGEGGEGVERDDPGRDGGHEALAVEGAQGHDFEGEDVAGCWKEKRVC